MGKLGAATVAAGVLGSVPAALGQSNAAGDSVGEVATEPGASNPRVREAFKIRLAAANTQKSVAVPRHTTSGDEDRYPDHSASYSKCLLQDDIAVVNPAAWASFKKALNSGRNEDFENIILGGTRTLNGPQGSYAYDMEGSDSCQFGDAPSPGDATGVHVVPPYYRFASTEHGAQMAEIYWCSLLYDVAFTDYSTNATAIQAAAELTTLPGYLGPRHANGQVTPDLLFRGPFPGETIGPYISQFMITPTMFGAQPLNMQMQRLVSGLDYMTDTSTYLQVQNGIPTGLTPQFDPTLQFLHDGRGLASYTHVDVLFQAYFTAFLIMAGLGFPVNPDNPYVRSRTQNGFGTFGGPDITSCLGECAAKALNRVWYQKWLVHLVARPEEAGGALHQILSGNANKFNVRFNSNILNSAAPQHVFSKYGTYLLPQTFPEGSPSHPCYPTGHGAVAGACITFLKFFFDQTHVFPNPVVPTRDGLSLVPYTGPDAGQITVDGELNKLAHNVAYGHGLHAGIHWRASADAAITLGEAVAISILQDKARTYNEKFTVSFTKLDGNKVTISNE